MVCGDYRLSICVTNEGAAEMVIELDRKDISYPLATYPRVSVELMSAFPGRPFVPSGRA
jgi:hypothetical protein